MSIKFREIVLEREGLNKSICGCCSVLILELPENSSNIIIKNIKIDLHISF